MEQAGDSHVHDTATDRELFGIQTPLGLKTANLLLYGQLKCSIVHLTLHIKRKPCLVAWGGFLLNSVKMFLKLGWIKYVILHHKFATFRIAANLSVTYPFSFIPVGDLCSFGFPFIALQNAFLFPCFL